MKVHYFLFLLIISPFSCNQVIEQKDELITISVTEYKDKLKGFWLGQCIANMTDLQLRKYFLLYLYLSQG